MIVGDMLLCLDMLFLLCKGEICIDFVGVMSLWWML